MTMEFLIIAGGLGYMFFPAINEGYGKQNGIPFLVMEKRVGEIGAVTICRCVFLFVFSPAVSVGLILLGLRKHLPDWTADAWEWLTEEGT